MKARFSLLSVEWLVRVGLLFFEKDDHWTNQKSTKPQTKPNSKTQNEKHDLLCVNCRTSITANAYRIEVAGANQHHFTNPNAQSFDISLFEKANIVAHGITTSEFSWFPGYAWQIVLCPQCQIQLGWRFRRGDSPDFYGLITEHLIPDV